MIQRTGVMCAALLGACLPAGGALAQYAPAPVPVYRDAPPGYRGGLPPSWMVDDEDDARLSTPGYGRGSVAPNQGYIPQSSPQAAPQPGQQQPPFFARNPADQDVMRPPGEVGARQVAPAAPGTAPQQPGQQTASLPPEDQPETGEPKTLAPEFKKQLVSYSGGEPAGTIIIDTAHKYLFLTLGGGKAIRYGIGVGREGFMWSGSERVSRMAEWPDWHPPAEMNERQPYLPRFMAGGPGNPLGARALYLGKTLYRIHGTNQPSTIGSNVSSGCIRLLNEDIEDLYSRVQTGTRVVVLPNVQPAAASAKAQVPAGAPMQLGSNGATGSVNAAPLPAAR
jgi:lipoprotein-anchoring transpeptidase ErfK/SrfK